MHNDDNLLDRFLKNKVEEASFDFKEEYWLKASQMLDEEDKKKKRPLFWRWFTLLFVVLAVGAGTFILSNRSNDKKAEKQVAMKQPGKADISAATTTPSAIQADISYNADRPANAPEANSTATATITDEKQTDSKPNSNIKADLPAKNNATSLTAATDLPNERKTDEASAADVPGSKTSGKKENTKLRTKAKKDRKEKSALAHNNKRAPALPIVSQSKDAGSRTGKPAGKEDNNENNTVLLQGKMMQPVDTQIFFSRPPRDESVFNPRYQPSLSNYVSERLDSITVLTFKPLAIAKAENAAPSPDIKKDTAVNPAKKNPLRLFIAGGANVNKGFKGNASTSVSWGVAPYLNLGAEKNINNKISLAAQIGFTYFNALNVQKKVVHYKYSFGYDSTQFSVEYKRMYQMTLPVSVAYQLNKFHNVWASLGASYVLNTFSKVTDQGNSAYQSGYQEGINPFDLFAQLGYQYKLGGKFALQAFLQQGFMSATKKDFFNINNTNTQTRLSVGLKYYFKRNGN